MSWTCVLLIATDRARLSLRRYASGKLCSTSGHGIHDASTAIGTAPIVIGERGTWHVDAEELPHTDPRWPAACTCGYRFEDGDAWQLFQDRLYRREDTGALLTLREAEPGMLWDASWFVEMGWAGPDGRSLVMRLPGNGEWTIDGPSQNGPGWERTGEPPRITVRPSILSYPSTAGPGYHGWLTDGILSDDLEGRIY